MNPFFLNLRGTPGSHGPRRCCLPASLLFRRRDGLAPTWTHTSSPAPDLAKTNLIAYQVSASKLLPRQQNCATGLELC